MSFYCLNFIPLIGCHEDKIRGISAADEGAIDETSKK